MPKKRSEEEMRVVYWRPVACPACDSEHVVCVAKSKLVRGMRYHRCQDCEYRFKSFEAPSDVPPQSSD
jgi:transposase-like protein